MSALPRRVVIAHNPVGPDDDPSTSDVLAQAGLVAEGLAALGVEAETVAVPAGRPWEVLPAAPGPLVFNLIESPPGSPQVSPAAAAALEAMGLAFTGAPAAALWLTTDKLATRAVLAAAGVPVAPGGRLDPGSAEGRALLDAIPPPWIVKPACEDASVGLEGNPVCADREAALARASALSRRFPGQPVLVERFLPGRELNVSLLDGEDGPEVLPVAEMLFLDLPPELPRALVYEAKWHEESFLYRHTVRRFVAAPGDAALLAEVRELALATWRLCGLAGYGRVDIRLDEHGRPCVLEANANPCIAPEAGMMAAAEQAGLGARDLVRRILLAARRRAAGAWPEPAPRIAYAPGTEPPPPAAAGLAVRDGIELPDRPAIERLLRRTGFFNDEEVAVALELADARLAEGPGCHYRFLVAEVDGAVAGYACWGPIPGTRASADLYWIAVDPAFQKRGVGAALLAEAERRMAGEGRSRVYVETSTRPQYEPTRRFYLGNGYRLAAELPEYYAPGDGKAVFLKVL